MLKGFLVSIEKIESDLDQIENVDDIRLLQIRLALLYDRVAEAARNTRTCPGPYWRKPTGKKSKRFRQDDEPCSGHFTKMYTGPPRDNNAGTRTLCDACGQMMRRDQKRGIIQKKNE